MPAGFPSGIPGIGDDMDGTMQHAPHAWRQFIPDLIIIIETFAHFGNTSQEIPDRKLFFGHIFPQTKPLLSRV
jgi:hypothetical protein